MADTSLVVPLITAGGTLVAAVVTGFGAASLKHKWDMDADDKRWARERAERRRDELRTTIGDYFGQHTALRNLAVAYLMQLRGNEEEWSAYGIELRQLLSEITALAAATSSVEVLVGLEKGRPFRENYDAMAAWALATREAGMEQQKSPAPPGFARKCYEAAEALLSA